MRRKSRRENRYNSEIRKPLSLALISVFVILMAILLCWKLEKDLREGFLAHIRYPVDTQDITKRWVSEHSEDSGCLPSALAGDLLGKAPPLGARASRPLQARGLRSRALLDRQ